MEQQVIQTKTETKAEKIRTLLIEKVPVKTIAATVGTTSAVVYGVRARMLKAMERKRRAELRFRIQAKKQAKAQELASSSAAPITPTIPTVSPLEVPPGVRISERTGKPVRKYTKGKSVATPKKSIAERGEELRRLTEEAMRIARASAPAPAPIRYIEVEVPQPHYNLTWKQRFTALFFGRV
jgi:hypothetical protein